MSFSTTLYRFVGAKSLNRADSCAVTYNEWQSESFVFIAAAPFPFGDGVVVFAVCCVLEVALVAAG